MSELDYERTTMVRIAFKEAREFEGTMHLIFFVCTTITFFGLSALVYLDADIRYIIIAASGAVLLVVWQMISALTWQMEKRLAFIEMAIASTADTVLRMDTDGVSAR